MSQYSKYILYIIFTLLFFSCKNTPESSKNQPSNKPKSQTISKLETYSNGKITVSSYNFDNLEKLISLQNDTTYVVNFWATWCAPCVEELPYFEQANKQYKNQKVKFLLVNLDFPKMIESRLLPFMEEHNIQSEVLILNDPDANSWIDKIDPNWEGNIPITIIHNKKKRAFYDHTFTKESLITEIEKFVTH
ncbi:MAG: TlpA disulfide reductase family protein [Capnocytophaga sp.]|nr:TlpA disulfide reductase family protein [Capnocytophaga sp.]